MGDMVEARKTAERMMNSYDHAATVWPQASRMAMIESIAKAIAQPPTEDEVRAELLKYANVLSWDRKTREISKQIYSILNGERPRAQPERNGNGSQT